MIVQGQITAVAPPDYSNKYGVQYQNITINTPTAGAITGRIGTKTPFSQQDIGQQIQLECEQAQKNDGSPYNKFKRYNPDYQQGQQTQAQPQQKRDYNAENRGKCRTQFIKAAIIAGKINCTSYNDVIELTEFAMTGIIPPNSRQPAVSTEEDDIPF
jgi:hypothetical protein